MKPYIFNASTRQKDDVPAMKCSASLEIPETLEELQNWELLKSDTDVFDLAMKHTAVLMGHILREAIGEKALELSQAEKDTNAQVIADELTEIKVGDFFGRSQHTGESKIEKAQSTLLAKIAEDPENLSPSQKEFLASLQKLGVV